MKICDDLLEKLADFYSSDFVKHNMAYLHDMTFEEYFKKQSRRFDWEWIRKSYEPKYPTSLRNWNRNE